MTTHSHFAWTNEGLTSLLELLFVLFAYWLLQLFLSDEPRKGTRFARLSNQVAPA